MSIVVDLDDPNYGEYKAVELILEAKRIASQISADSAEAAGERDEVKLLDEYQEKVSQAISLLGLAKVQRRGTQKKQDAKRS